MSIIWIIVIISALVIEALTSNLVTIWISLGAFAAAISSYFTDDIQVQISIFFIVTIITLLATKNLVKKLVLKKIKTNLDAVVGKRGIVIKSILKDEVGRVKVMGKDWAAISDEELNEGTKVEILEIKGVKLVVKEVKE